MPMVDDATLRLLIIDDSVEAAEAIVSGLRNAGIAVRPSRLEDADSLPAQLSGQSADLVLASMDTSLPLEQLLSQVSASGKDLPALLLAEAIDDEVVLRTMELGARRVVLRSRIDHVEHAVRGEWADLHARRALRRLESQLRETERRCDALIDSSRDPIAYVHEGMHIRANEAYLEMFGFESFEDIEGMSLLDLVAPQHVDDFKQLLKRLARGEAPPPRYEVEARTLEGGSFPAVMEFIPATYEGEQCLQVVLRRQELDPELAREVEELRHRDVVTGLLNRPTFLRHLEEVVNDAASHGGSHCVLLVEPDHYARLVEEIGMESADTLLAACARRLEGALGEGDMAGRLGEHQLAVLRRGSDYHGTVALAEKVREAFSAAVLEAGDRSINATVSIGGVQIGERIASLNEVLAKLHHCTQTSSSVGGNRVQIFDPGAVDRAEEERVAAWVSRIRDALDGDRFVLHYQPLVPLHAEPSETYDVYLRLRDEDGQLTRPMSFMPIAEENGLLWEIDRWVVRQTIACLAERRRAGRQTVLMARISDASLQDASLVELVRKELAEQGVAGSQLVLQVPESKVSTMVRVAQEFRRAMAELGVRMSLDQFGSGLNSFQLLEHFGSEFVRIDRAVAEDLASSAENQQRIREITERAHELHKQVIVEAVEDAATMSVLFGAGIDYAQGYFLAPPGPEMNYEFG